MEIISKRMLRRPGRPARPFLAVVMVLSVVALASSSCASPGASSASGLADPSGSVTPHPDYSNVCAPTGVDMSTTCLRLTLAAVDQARALEGVKPMVLPSDFPHLTVAEQLFIAVDSERVDRGLRPFVGLTAILDQNAAQGADHGGLPPRPGAAYRYSDAEWIGDVVGGLDADYQWMYFDGRGSGLPSCAGSVHSGCWADRHVVLDRLAGSGNLVMGAALDPTGDTSGGDRGGPSLAATMAAAARPGGQFVYTWSQALRAMKAGTLRPLRQVPANESDTGIPDPPRNVPPDPNYLPICAPSGIDSSTSCVQAVLAATNHARALEGVKPMVLPTNFGQLTIPEQLFVAVDLERVARGLAPFVGLTAALDANAQKGADQANDPPDPGSAYLLVDGEWAGGSSNGLDAVYGWMYDDGLNSGNLDCGRQGAAGCWGHRKGILDDFGTGGSLVMGAALNPTGDTSSGDENGTSMAVTMAVAATPPKDLLFTWAQVEASLPGAGTAPPRAG